MKSIKLSKPRARITILFIILALLIPLVILSPGLAQLAPEDTFEIPWFSIDSGGARLSGSGYTLRGAAAQPDAGEQTSAGYTLTGGFFAGGGEAPALDHHVYLPLAVR